MRAAVIGASGYSGGELLRLLAEHPHFECSAAIAHTLAGEEITSVHSQLAGSYTSVFLSFHHKCIEEADVIFLALPHGESGKLIADNHAIFDGKKIVDLGADFRLSSSTSWSQYYGGEHFGTWQYGLAELPGNREKIAASSKIANPGCYATAISLALAPFAQIGERADFEDVVITAASGTTGAGRSGKINLTGSEVMNSISAYKVGGIHQHTPEIEEAISSLTKCPVKISFTPLLAPLPRGIIASLSIPIKDSNESEVRSLFKSYYEREQFVHLLQSGRWPSTNSLLGSNAAHIQVTVDNHVNRAIVVVAIDNLGKGAAGQAIQNANIIFGFSENAGLTKIGTR